MSFDAGACRIVGGPVITTETVASRLPAAIVATARHLGPLPWDPGEAATCMVVEMLAGGIATDGTGAVNGVRLLDVALDDPDQLPERITRADAMLATLRHAHRVVQVHRHIPERATWPPLVLDPDTGAVTVHHDGGGSLYAGQADTLVGSWARLSVRLELVHLPRVGWVPVTWAK